jgi:CRP/FNR family transcriptional regulator, polysaccharide utilization system transcription regulator
MKLNLKEHCINCANKSPLFKLLKQSELEIINQGRHEVMYNAGETIFKQGSPLSHVLSFNYGLAKIHVQGAENKTIILRLVKPVEFVSGMGMFLDNKNQFSLTALEGSSVCFIDKENFKKVMQHNFVFTEAFIRHNQTFQSNNLRKLINLNQKNAKGKIADALLYLSNEIYKNDSFTSHLSKSELAELSGISKESAFKVLNEFECDGIIIITSNKIEIQDKRRLELISNKG